MTDERWAPDTFSGRKKGPSVRATGQTLGQPFDKVRHSYVWDGMGWDACENHGLT